MKSRVELIGMNPIRVEARPGAHRHRVVAQGIELATILGEPVLLRFNDSWWLVHGDGTEAEIKSTGLEENPGGWPAWDGYGKSDWSGYQ